VFESSNSWRKKCDEILPENNWNVDEKESQMGGGQKGDGRKFFFLCTAKECYQIKSDNLELVTIIKVISAAGFIAPPTFVLTEGPIPDC
jgi:hypothetical protein